MKALVSWAVKNSPALNTLMVGVMLVGAMSLATMRREVFPQFDLEIILVTVPYPGASPAEVEEGICQKIEEAVRSITGIKKQTAVAEEGMGFMILELESGSKDVQKVLNEVRSEVDRIPSFPELAEEPEVKQITLRYPVIRVGVIGPDVRGMDAELELRDLTEKVRYDILRLPSISQAKILGGKKYQIDIEMTEETLREYGLTLRQVAQIVRRENVELPGGTMKSDYREVLLRGKGKRLHGTEIAKIPLITQPDGAVLTVGDLGRVSDAFADEAAISEIDGKPGLVVSVSRASNEDLFAIVEEIKNYVRNAELPEGYRLITWADRSVDVKDRMDLLVRNGLQGLALVVLVLAIFLDLRLSFWVALGIPVSILGTGAVLLYLDQTVNMISMFAFLMALGILVDDAIVIGENIYEHRQRGTPPMRAAVDGTIEVLPSVMASVGTTIIAFTPLMFVAGVMGKFIAVMPVAVITMLVISLIESTFILPCHLAHSREHRPRPYGAAVRQTRQFCQPWPPALRWTVGPLLVTAVFLLMHVVYPFRRVGDLFHWLSDHATTLLGMLIRRIYRPLLHWIVRRPFTVLASAAALLLVSLGLVEGGITPYILFPKIDSNSIYARVIYPDGTPASVTDAGTRHMLEALERVDRRYRAQGMGLVQTTRRAVGMDARPDTMNGAGGQSSGSHVGLVEVELVDTTQRAVNCHQILAEWRKETGDLVGAEYLVFDTPEMGPGGKPIEFKLLADVEHFDKLEQAVEQCKTHLGDYPGVVDIRDDSLPGKWEYQLQIKDQAVAMGVPLADLAETVRDAYYGAEVMRLQRGRHEVKLMVRYPAEQRRDLADFDEIRVRTGDGAERPLTELAKVNVARGYSEINRVDQQRSITITADVIEGVGKTPHQIVKDLQANYLPGLRAQYPFISVRWEGEQEQTNESMSSLRIGFVVALLAMFVLLTIEFRSYVQPVIVMAIVPFGVVGAIWGHALMGLPLTIFTMFGLVALTGVVVNDSIVLIDFINHRIDEGLPLYEALVDAGSRRFRPVLLTSVTTIAGLFPILTETSFQAQVLIPMAATLVFGLMMATTLVLLLVPASYAIYWRFTNWQWPASPAAEVAAPRRQPLAANQPLQAVPPD